VRLDLTNKFDSDIIELQKIRKEHLNMNPDDIVQCEECGAEIRVEDCYMLADG
jgi:RNA polymerase-binding transcription factor DksA